MNYKKLRANLIVGASALLLAGEGNALPLGYVPDVISPFYFTGNSSFTQSAFGLQGIKSWPTDGWYILTGTSGTNGVVYIGPIDHGSTPVPSNTIGSNVVLTPLNQIPSCVSSGGSGSGQGSCGSSGSQSTQGGWFVMNYNGYSTSIYGPDVIGNGNVNLVGSLVQSGTSTPTIGFYYAGPVTNTPNQANFNKFQATNGAGTPADFTFIHSVSGGATNAPLAVGNYGYQGSGSGNPWGYAFVYNPSTKTKVDITFPDYTTDKTHTAYGIWYNGDGTYTIAGGVGLGNQPTSDYVYGEPLPLGQAYLMDYNPTTGVFYNYQTFSYTPKGADVKLFRGKSIITHFEGIWRDPKTGDYRLPATVTYTAANGLPSFDLARAKVVTVRRDPRGHFQRSAVWNEVAVPGGSVVTNDSISGDTNIGLVIYPEVKNASGDVISGAIISDYAETPIKRQ
jgi:hypothetical protein